MVRTAITIVLVRLKSQGPWKHDPDLTLYTLETVESIKGTGQPQYEFVSFGSRYSGEDFQAHRARQFWSKDIGRSAFPCCICGPDHAFREGETYLYFPELLGSMKSAEIVRGADDKWLAYVRSRVKAAAKPAPGVAR